MSQDHFSETSSTGWLGRIGSSIKGVLFGLVLLVISVPILFFNEGRAVKTARTLDEGAKTVITVSAEKPDPANDRKLIYFTGRAEAEGSLADPDFGVSAEALKLRRKVEFYQWEEEKKSETKKKLGGGEETVTTYDYRKAWGEKHEDSSDFKHPEGHENPQPAINGKDWVADPITVGRFTLSQGLVRQIGNFTNLAEQGAVELPEKIAGKAIHREAGGFYLGENPDSPVVGDIRVGHEVANPGDVSVVAAQVGTSGLEAFIAKAGGSIEILETGKHGAASMFATAQRSNRMLTWVLRIVGAVLMFAGFALLFRPLSVLADVLPIAGDIVGFGTGLVALSLALPLSLLVISVAWIFYRPLIGIPLVVAAFAGIVWLVRKLAEERKQRAGFADR